MSQMFQCLACKGTYPDVQRDGSVYFHACAPLPQDAAGNQSELANKRDENLSYNSSGRLIGIKSEGDGVKCLTSPKVSEPAWLAPVRKLIAKEETTDDVDTAV